MSRAKRILIISDAGGRPEKMFLDQGWKLAKGFIRLGHDARVFSYRNALLVQSPVKSKRFSLRFFKNRADESLAACLRVHGPEIVIVGFDRGIDERTIQRCREAAPGAVFLGCDGDPWPDRWDRTRVGAALDIVTATNDGEFLDAYRRSGTPLCAFLPNVCDPDIDRRYEVDDRWRSDFLWTGKTRHGVEESDAMRQQIVPWLAARPHAGVYGCLGRSAISGTDYLHAISGARIGVSINAINSIRLYHSDRLTHYTAGGAFVLAKRVPDTDLLFQDGVHLKYFDSAEEFFNLAEWFLAHEEERARIADAGMEHAHRCYNATVIAGYILDLVEKGKYSAPWT